ncbi:MAG: hypothetical protein A2Y62_11490 [Candidatus Fischerbacteria bacterium RBG_13_37_8]|uniref:Polymerase nucleotidyl transferase domain-containing protein n=1 Tax=Candidatus Fischerbacteria bacterium RBG_13_37_8 TaxID=1817863 RepID=A0A1F5VXY9_9BACT|nr:MAG: hypothetical protein A2Y62_11490 [Candidatus Fischerbacteria bacterium RBG_13_37_8]
MHKLKEISQRKNERKAKLQASSESILIQLKSMGALKIVLFGSLAIGEVDVNSDLDLLVIMPSSRTGKEWMDIIYEKVERKIASDIIVYSLQEFQQKLPSSSFLQNIMQGKVLYEKTA